MRKRYILYVKKAFMIRHIGKYLRKENNSTKTFRKHLSRRISRLLFCFSSGKLYHRNTAMLSKKELLQKMISINLLKQRLQLEKELQADKKKESPAVLTRKYQ